MEKKFKILKTNLEKITDTHFKCKPAPQTNIFLFNQTEPFRCVKFDGIWVTLVRGDEYVYGEVHG